MRNWARFSFGIIIKSPIKKKELKDRQAVRVVE